MKSRSSGFTLIEMAVAMFIIVLVLGSMLIPLQTQVEQRQISDTQKTLEETKEALVGFALTKGYLPCPDKSSGATTGPNDTPNDGVEDYNTTGNCTATNSEGNVPWATLSVANSDVWGNRFRYRVTGAFAQRPTPTTPTTPTFTLSTTGNLTISCPAPACNPSQNHTTSAPAIILSHGKNGLGAISASTGSPNPLPTSTDEQENTDGNATFASRTLSAAGSTADEFDDIVTWLSPNILFNRMVAAGKLP